MDVAVAFLIGLGVLIALLIVFRPGVRGGRRNSDGGTSVGVDGSSRRDKDNDNDNDSDGGDGGGDGGGGGGD
jgi:hypothetical protein